MKFVLEIELGNDAMHEPEDVALAMSVLAVDFTNAAPNEFTRGNVRDINGNTVGRWEVKP